MRVLDTLHSVTLLELTLSEYQAEESYEEDAHLSPYDRKDVSRSDQELPAHDTLHSVTLLELTLSEYQAEESYEEDRHFSP